MPRQLVHADGFEGFECDSCEWIRPTPHFIPEGKTGAEAIRDEFDAHECEENTGPTKYDDFRP